MQICDIFIKQVEQDVKYDLVDKINQSTFFYVILSHKETGNKFYIYLIKFQSFKIYI